MNSIRHLKFLCFGVSAAVLIVGFAGAGCSSLGKAGSASFASVTITNHAPDEIARATVSVFQADGYSGHAAGREMVFEKEGTRGDNIAYQGVIGTHYGAQTANRVKAQIVPAGPNTWRLQCQAYIVRDPGQGFYEEEQRLANIRSGPYQDLLDKVAAQLK